MVFSSMTFLFYFLPIMLLLYYVTPKKLKNLTLLVGSLIFYFAGEPIYIGLLIFSTVVDYSHSLVISRNRGGVKAKLALISSITINLSMLIFFKYSDFLIYNLNRFVGSDFKLLELSLPIGISFFTFQTMSYTIDVYRDEAKPQRSLVDLATYVSLFPQLIAGPIIRYKTIANELNERVHSYELFGYGVKRFIIGLGKKVIMANTLGELAVTMKYSTNPSLLSFWLSAIAFALQIYYDFSGYSDMAIGLGRMFGFHFQENFNYPYISKSISEFWNRWHMSLGQWFKDYVYIPLGGNKKGKLMWIRNIALVWILTGFWHGASWNFLLWGGVLGSCIILEKLFLLKLLGRLPDLISHVYVLLIIILSFVIFNNENLSEISKSFLGMFGGLALPLMTNEALYYGQSHIIMLVVACIGATPFMTKALALLRNRGPYKIVEYVSLAFYSGLFLIVTGYLVDSSFNPFLYFRF